MYVKVLISHFYLGSKLAIPGEQLLKNKGLCAADCGLSLADRNEQEYLLALSAQYQVEQYEDCYDLTGERKPYECAKGIKEYIYIYIYTSPPPLLMLVMLTEFFMIRGDFVVTY